VGDSTREARIDDGARRLGARGLRLRVDGAVEQTERLRLVDPDSLGVRTNETADENVCWQTRKCARFELLDRGSRNFRGGGDVADRQRSVFASSTQAVSKMLVIHGVGNLQNRLVDEFSLTFLDSYCLKT